MALKEDLQKALTELRKEKERKFDQTVDLIINLQKYDLKKNPVNLFVSVPHKIKDKKIAGFLETKNKNVETITPDQFKKYSDKKELKKATKKYDFFIAEAKLMPKVATTFGRVLGPAGKMPSPQMGIIMGNVNDQAINDLKNKINKGVKLKLKEASMKLAIGKVSMKDSDIIENAMTVYNALVKALPRDKENIKNIEIKFTMTKPKKIQIK
jgi:large subunit ribosomal protein L1